MVAALLLHPLIGPSTSPGLEGRVRTRQRTAALAALDSSMLRFIVFVFSVLVLPVLFVHAAGAADHLPGLPQSGDHVSPTFFVFSFSYRSRCRAASVTRCPRFRCGRPSTPTSLSSIIYVLLIDPGEVPATRERPHPARQPGPEDLPRGVPAAARRPRRDADQFVLPARDAARTVASGRTGAVLAFDVAGLAEFGPARRLPGRARAPGGRFRDRRGRCSASSGRGGHCRRCAAPVGRHRPGAHVGAGPGSRFASSWISPPRRSRRRSTTRPPPCWPSTRSTACCERSPSGSWTRGGSTTPPGGWAGLPHAGLGRLR